MQNQGRALIGIGMAEGEDKAIAAAEKANPITIIGSTNLWC